uniref:Peptidase C1A papain C-terminal domain-containing protein n=1 Tax=Timema shepardi TaxID=629360 RepID=A0A7R9FV53_TIMSH|nr:unnamed protein product [Timema shepardi]
MELEVYYHPRQWGEAPGQFRFTGQLANVHVVLNSTAEDGEIEVRISESMTMVEKLNNNRSSNLSAVYGITKFSDLTQDEFIKHHLVPKLHHHVKLRLQSSHAHHNRIKTRALPDQLPLKVDWREKKVLTPIRNQRTCGACWAFSVVETVETMSAIKTGSLQVLSVQEVIDCARNGNMGCDGGDTCNLLEWLVASKTSIEPEKMYPFTWLTQSCKLKGMVGQEDMLMTLLASHGPVAVAVNALNWQNYLGGIIQFHCDGGVDQLNHAVQLVGYDRSGPTPFYIARNSWGADFGDRGFLYLAIGSNICGLATEVASLDVL